MFPVRRSEVSNFKFLRIGAKYLVYDPKKDLRINQITIAIGLIKNFHSKI